MKLICLLLIFLATVVHPNFSMDRAELRRQFMADKRICLGKHPLTAIIIAKLRNLELVDDHSLKEYVGCLGMRRDYVYPNGSYNDPKLISDYFIFVGGPKPTYVITDCTRRPIRNDPQNSFWRLIRCYEMKVPGKEYAEMVSFYWVL